MIILFISFYSKPENVSSSYYVDDLKRKLIKERHIVHTLAPNPVRNLSKKDIDMWANVPFESTDVGKIIRVFVNKNSSNSKINRIIRMLIFKKKIRKFIKENKNNYDCIFYYSNPPILIPLMLGKMCKKLGIISVYQINDIWPNITGKLSFLMPLAKKAISLASEIITLSDDMQNYLQKLFPNKSITIIRIWPYESTPNDVVDTEVVDLFLRDRRFKICYIGNIGEFQNIELLIETASLLRDKKDIIFYFVGGGRLVDYLKTRIQRDNLKNVVYITRVNDVTAQRLYANSNLNIISLKKGAIFYCCPSKTSSCILSPSNCLLIMDDSYFAKNLVTNHGFYFNGSFDSKQISDQILDIFKSDHNNRIKVSEFEYDKKDNINKWLGFFEKIKI